MEMIEITASSVDDAIQKGLAELRAAPGDVMVEVLQEPNTGLFGFGTREARVRLVLIGRRSASEDDSYDDDEDNEDENTEDGYTDDEIWIRCN